LIIDPTFGIRAGPNTKGSAYWHCWSDSFAPLTYQ